MAMKGKKTTRRIEVMTGASTTRETNAAKGGEGHGGHESIGG